MKISWRGSLGRLAVFICLLLLPGYALANFDPVAEVAARLEKAEKEKTVVDGKLAVLNPKLEGLRNSKVELEQTIERLEKLKLRLKGIQLWNAFVGVMGVVNDSVTKVSPGSNIAVFLAGFAQDRAFGELADQSTRMQAKIKSFPATVLGMSQKMKDLQDTVAMSEMDVAKKLVNEGAVKLVPTPLIRLPGTSPLDSLEAVAGSAAVVTGKVRYIQEAINPALEEIRRLISDMDELITGIEQEKNSLEKRSKQLAEETQDWRRQLGMQQTIQRDKVTKETQASIAKSRDELSRVPSSWIRYTPLDRGVLNILRTAYDEIKESGTGGYDQGKLEKGITDYRDAKRELMETARKQYSEARSQVQKRAQAIYAACVKWTEECSRRYDNEVTKAYESLDRSSQADRNLFEAEEREIASLAATRALKMNANLLSGMAKIAADFAQIYDAVMKERQALSETMRVKAPRPPFSRMPDNIRYLAESGRWSGFTTADRPGDIIARAYDTFSELEGWKDSLTASVELLTGLPRKEEELYKRLDTAVERAWNSYRQLVPEKLRMDKKPIPWPNDPNKYYAWNFSLYTNYFSFGPIQSHYLAFKLPPAIIASELKWFKDFRVEYERDMPIAERLLTYDFRGVKMARTGDALTEALNDYTFRGDWDKERELARRRFTQKDGKPGDALSPDQSDGARYLADMKAAWAAKKKDVEEMLALYKLPSLHYYDKNPFTYRPLIESMAKIPEKIKLYEEIMASSGFSQKDIVAITKFYESFRQAYEGRNHSLLVSHLADDWSAGDGTTISDLQRSLRDSFAVYNSIRYNMTGLTVTKTGENRYRTSYRVTIQGRILANNIRHEEKSEVSEEVVIDRADRVKITRTLTGKFWQ